MEIIVKPLNKNDIELKGCEVILFNLKLMMIII